MATTKTQIFNITLNILGVSSPIENANSSDNKAILLNNYYNLARDYVLKDFDWNFANAVIELSPIYSDEYKSSLYKYCYDYPNNCICARDVFEKNSYVIQKFIVSCLQSGEKVIFTDANQAILRYTKRVDKEVYFSPEFTMALSYYLASLTSNVITGSIQKGEIAHEKYLKILRRAKVLNAQEGADIVLDDTTYIDSRI